MSGNSERKPNDLPPCPNCGPLRPKRHRTVGISGIPLLWVTLVDGRYQKQCHVRPTEEEMHNFNYVYCVQCSVFYFRNRPDYREVLNYVRNTEYVDEVLRFLETLPYIELRERDEWEQ